MKKLFTFLLAAATTMAASAVDDVPASPTGLKLHQLQGDDYSSGITLTWNLPTAYTDGSAMADATVNAIKVYRDNKEIALLDGPATTFTDQFEEDGNPNGYSFGLNVYEVSARVGDVWSATCLPEQIVVGEQIAWEILPWQPDLKDLSSTRFENSWWFSDGWAPTDKGLTYTYDGVTTADGWLIGPGLSLMLLPRRSYVAEFKVVADAEASYTVGLADHAPENMDFIQVIADNRTATPEGEVQRMEFVYEPKDSKGKTFWSESIYFAIYVRMPTDKGKVNLTLSDVKLTETGTASAQNVARTAEITDIEVYNLQGIYMGSADSLSLPGYAPGLYVVRYTEGGTIRSTKVRK